jgi:hypothetical protein
VIGGAAGHGRERSVPRCGEGARHRHAGRRQVAATGEHDTFSANERRRHRLEIRGLSRGRARGVPRPRRARSEQRTGLPPGTREACPRARARAHSRHSTSSTWSTPRCGRGTSSGRRRGIATSLCCARSSAGPLRWRASRHRQAQRSRLRLRANRLSRCGRDRETKQGAQGCLATRSTEPVTRRLARFPRHAGTLGAAGHD